MEVGIFYKCNTYHTFLCWNEDIAIFLKENDHSWNRSIRKSGDIEIDFVFLVYIDIRYHHSKPFPRHTDPDCTVGFFASQP